MSGVYKYGPGPITPGKRDEYLIDTMRNWADEHPESPRARELYQCADKIEEACQRGSAKDILGAWVVARAVWLHATGDKLA